MICNHQISIGQSYTERQDAWVYSVLNNMSLDQKIGQIFMIRAYSKGDVAEEKAIKNIIRKYHIGGLCFFQGSPVDQAILTNEYQSTSRLPMLIGLDAEWGLGMRFEEECFSFPNQLLMGASRNDNIIFEIGKEIGRQCKRIGVNINFAPVVDINNNPKNPVIFDRSFGESAEEVTKKASRFVQGLESEGVMSCVKHFPGHGDTDTDSHHSLPYLYHSIDRLESVELRPFRSLLTADASSVMVGHLHVPSIDARRNRPTSLSANAVRILREDIGFDGLVITDAMDMKAITHHWKNGAGEVEAFIAGNDIILLPQDVKVAIQAIKNAIASGKISEERLNQSVIRILKAKFKVGLTYTPKIDINGLTNDINSKVANGLSEQIIESSITLVKDDDNLIPIRQIDHRNFAVLSVNAGQKSKFQERINSYSDIRHYQMVGNKTAADYQQMLSTLTQFHHVIVGVHTSGKLYNFKKEVPEEFLNFLQKLQSKVSTTIVVFGSPYVLTKFDFAKSLILSYDNTESSQDITAQAIFGAIDILGKLPVTVSSTYTIGQGIDRQGLKRLGYATPERVGMSSQKLLSIDSVMSEVIASKAAPGGQVLIAKNGKIVFNKNYGMTYPNGRKVTSDILYDVASLTKVLSTTLATMTLYDEGKIDITQPLKRYLPNIDTTNKADLIIQDIMAHHGKLMPWIAFYENTIDHKIKFGYNPVYYSGFLHEDYRIPVAKGMFMRADYRDTMWQQILESPLRTSNSYRYSDLGFYIMQRIVESESRTKLDLFCKSMFYEPLNLKHTLFKPLDHYPAQQIAPTNIDNYWRNQIIVGHVHDMGSAMLGGVGGHAGLFSNASDVAVIMQMLLNKGEYGGQRFISPQTVELFTSRHILSTRRGIGFDMKELDSGKTMNMSELASSSTFGHTGFTGTAAFADPESQLTFVFMSNRTYPDDSNNLLINKDIRKNIHTILYKAMTSRP